MSRYSFKAVIAASLLALAGCEADIRRTASVAAPAVMPIADVPEGAPDIDALIAEMSLDEKLAQISCIWMDKAKVLDSDGAFVPEKMAAEFPHGIGCFARPQDTIGMEDQGERKSANDSTVIRRMSARTPSQTAELTNAIQRWHIDNTRLGIPTLFHEEGLHGFQGRYATSFPQALGLAATFDTDLVQEVYAITAREIRARGAHHVLSPVVDVARDARWGRIEETFGEDPFLVSRMGVAAVRGFQGDGFPIADDKVVATLKHMTGHGQPESGMNVGPAQISERELREIFFPPFEAAVKEANAATVMASYNEIDGIPSHANDWLLNDVLRGEWGFTGAVVADYFAINELQGRHKIVDNLADAGALALSSGVDIELPDGVAFYEISEKLADGTIDEAMVDQAVRRMLLTKARAKLWETPFANGAVADAVTGNAAARAVALEAAHKSAVLLKNDGLLPLSDESQTFAVIGPNSDVVVLGGYSDEPRQVVSVLDGMRAALGEERVLHAKGVELTDNRSWWDDEVALADPEANRTLIEKAVEVARRADVVVLVVGGDESTSREAWSETHMGDRNDITLIGEQRELIEAIAELDKPTVGVVISGRPLALADVQDHFDAMLYGFLLGQETGTAVADILLGNANPSGKLPVTLPRSVGHLPVFYNHKPTARRGYAFEDVSPLYPFGFGLSYTEFEMGAPTLSADSVAIGEPVTFSVAVTNTGDVAGEEVVQVYLRDELASVTRRVKELKGFARVALAPGETQTVSVELSPEAFTFYNRDMERVAEPGAISVMVGPNSSELQTVTLTLTE